MPRAVWEFPLQTEESIVTIDGLSDADAANYTNTRCSTFGGCLSPSSEESEYYSIMVRGASEDFGSAITVRELGHEAHVRTWTDVAAARGLALRSGSGAIKHKVKKYFWLLQKQKYQELWIEKIRGTVNPADLVMKHVDGNRLMTLCDLFNNKHIGGRPSSALMLTMDTEHISRTSRALVAMTLVGQAGASEIAMLSGAEHETWIDGYRADCWTAACWITEVIMIWCTIMSLVQLWWKSGRVAKTIDNGTHTLEEGESDCPFFVKSHVIQSLSWCSHCDPNDSLEKRAWRRRIGF